MKEKENDNSIHDNNNSINEIKIGHDNMIELREIINTKKNFIIYINKSHLAYIDFHQKSFKKINQMINSQSEEYVIFLYSHRKTIFSSPYCSSKFSRKNISIGGNNSSSLSDHSGFDGLYRITEDFHKNQKDRNNYYSKNNLTKKIITSFNNLDRYFFYKWIYHIYLIIGIILFLHYITFIFSEYNNCDFYKLIGFLFIIYLIFFGYLGIKNKYSNFNINDYVYIRNYLFWLHFLILIMSMISLIALGLIGNKFTFVKRQGIFGFLIILIYITIIIIEIIYIFHFDIINKKIFLSTSNNDISKISELSIQLFDAS
jgi:hypothetical protein